MRTLAALAVLGLLGGCAGKIDEARCTGYGFQPGTEGFANCMMQRDQLRRSTMIAVGTEMMRQTPQPAAPAPPPPVNCTSHAYNGRVFTSCQ